MERKGGEIRPCTAADAAAARTEPVPGDLVSQAPAGDFAPVEATISGIIRDNALPGVCPVQGKP